MQRLGKLKPKRSKEVASSPFGFNYGGNAVNAPEVMERIVDKLFGDDEEPPAEGEEPQEEKDIEDQLKDEAKKRLKDLLGGD